MKMRSIVTQRNATDQPAADDRLRWEALVRRDLQPADPFVYAVLTTGVYCRPGCSSRLPLRKNVRFYDTAAHAAQAGFRACKRCVPDAAQNPAGHVQAIIDACRQIRESENPPPLRELADAARLSPYHFHRLFTRTVGVTPRQYAMQQRLNRVGVHLQQDGTVTEAAYNAGFASSSRFYQETRAGLGMQPTAYRNGAQGITIRYALARSYLGWVLVAATERGICSIGFGDSPEALTADLRARFPQAKMEENDPSFQALLAKVMAFLESPRAGLDLPLDIQGTAFQRRVWNALRQIPAGQTTSYAGLAAQVGQPGAARAVAQACAANTLAVAIPCHRVKRANGELGGYRWGVARKRALLERESS